MCYFKQINKRVNIKWFIGTLIYYFSSVLLVSVKLIWPEKSKMALFLLPGALVRIAGRLSLSPHGSSYSRNLV